MTEERLFAARKQNKVFVSLEELCASAREIVAIASERYTSRSRACMRGRIKNRLRFSVDRRQIRYNDSDKLKRMPKGYRGRAVDWARGLREVRQLRPGKLIPAAYLHFARVGEVDLPHRFFLQMDFLRGTRRIDSRKKGDADKDRDATRRKIESAKTDLALLKQNFPLWKFISSWDT